PRRAAGAPAQAVRPGGERPGPRGAAEPRPDDPRREGRRGALARATDDRGAADAVPRDPGRDEPARGVQRLRDGRGRARSRPGRGEDQREGPRAAPAEALAVRAGGDAPHGDGREDGAVPQGRAVRLGDREGGRPDRAQHAVVRPGRAAEAQRDRPPGRLAGADGPGCSVVTADDLRRAPGPGSGPGGAPTAIALSPILSARYRAQDLERVGAAAPGARIVTLSREGLTDEAVDDVEVLLRGWLSTDAFDRLLARAPRLTWVHSASAGVERALTPASRERGLVITNAR